MKAGSVADGRQGHEQGIPNGLTTHSYCKSALRPLKLHCSPAGSKKKNSGDTLPAGTTAKRRPVLDGLHNEYQLDLDA